MYCVGVYVGYGVVVVVISGVGIVISCWCIRGGCASSVIVAWLRVVVWMLWL